jgi:hypothetical protein
MAAVAVLQTLSGLGGRFVMPQVKLDLDRREVVEDFVALLSRIDVAIPEQETVRLP